MNVIKDANSISIYSPNLLILKRNGVAQSPTCDVKQELLLSLIHVLAESPKFETDDGALRVFLPKLHEDLELANEEVEITVKLFLLDPSVPPESSNIKDALETTLKWLNVKKADLLVLAFHGLLLQDDSEETQYKLDSKQISDIWKSMEEQNSNEKASELGVCEFSKTMLQSLLSSANIKPTVNQVNLSDCCVIPKSLRDYAKSENVKLFTHNDPNVSSTDFNTLLSESGTDVSFQPKWASRYSITYKSRGIVASRGYIVHAKCP